MRGVSGGVDTGAPPKRFDFDARIVGEDGGRNLRFAQLLVERSRLDGRVAGVILRRFFDIAVALISRKIEGCPGKDLAQFPQLSAILGRDVRLQRLIVQL
ncbi:MAG: hypothetical protein NVS9B12_14520 [Vulcanimicrobiaceae bacterium]